MKHAKWALELAQVVAKRSKDPSTKVGAVIFDSLGRVVSVGFNGFPMGVADLPQRLAKRDIKYRMMRHAEDNALAFANRDLDGCTIVITHPPCAQCAGSIVQHGLSKVIYPTPSNEMFDRWIEDFIVSDVMFQEAGVEVVEIGD
jgi:dCMP deaminase